MKSFFTSLFFVPFLIIAQNSFTPKAVGIIPSGYIINNIFTPSQNEVWATASSDDGSKASKVLKSIDNGNTWQVSTPDSSIKGYALDLYVANSKVAYVIIEDQFGSSYNYRTSDGGTTWKNTSFSYGVFVHAFSPSNVIVVGAANAWYSFDSFSTNTNVPWQQGGPPSFTPFGFKQLSGTQSQFTCDSGLYFGYSKGSLVRTQNQGKKWKAFRTTLDSLSAASSIANQGGTFLALRRYLNGKGGLSRSNNYGATWTNVTDSLPVNAGMQTLTSIPERKHYFMMGGYNAIMTSTDAGMGWKKTTLPSTVSSSGTLHLSNDTIAWLGGITGVGFEAAMYKIQLTPTKTGSVNKQTILGFHFYPNPSTDKIYIDANQDGQLSLLNSAGQLLFNTQLSELANGLDLSALPNGVYILQFEIEGQIINKKVIKLNN
jgi:photosystem II stability/assembly factor-like uncharacterized protein